MSETTSVFPGDGTPEAIAFKLFLEVAFVEGRNTYAGARAGANDRQWILDTYAECLKTVQNPHNR